MKKITNYAIDIDLETKNQFDHCCNQEFVKEASLMPDAHSGYVAPIGSVFITKDYIVPAWVGYDIGCGMIACKFKGKNLVSKVKKFSNKIYSKVNEVVPMGNGKVNHIKNVSDKTKDDFKKLLIDFKKGEYNEEVLKFLKNKALSHLGSLGSGNHFIEIGALDAKDELWLIIHSGSRGVGHTVATHYMKEFSGENKNYEKTAALKHDSKLGKEYLNVLKFGLDFALLNRLEMAYKVRDVIAIVIGDETLSFELWCNKNHNHAVKFGSIEGEFVHRKGATPAEKKERGVIPANMRDGCFLVEGLGNFEFLFSSSHGAGRKMSRAKAKKEIGIGAFRESMKGIIGTINEKTIDEAPMAYKNIFEVMEAQKNSVKVIGRVTPIINWKGQ